VQQNYWRSIAMHFEVQPRVAMFQIWQNPSPVCRINFVVRTAPQHRIQSHAAFAGHEEEDDL
jgi:hypothetical protein